ncbi:MAG: hypothetical protein V3R85_05810 [Alphaproteobacteria bacterium]
MMIEQVSTDKADGAGDDSLHPAPYVVRSPEIVWLPDEEPAVVESDPTDVATEQDPRHRRAG